MRVPVGMDVITFEAEVGAVEDPAALWRLVAALFDGTPVERIMYHHLPPLGALDAGRVNVTAAGVPEELVDEYVRRQLYRSNPMLRHALQSVEPFYFDEVAPPPDLPTEEREFYEAVRAADFLRGLGVQVFGPSGRNAYCGLGFKAGVTRLDPETVRTMQWVCQLAHLRYCGLLQPVLGPPPKLSERELEVLRWVAKGKSNAIIGELLGISGNTVDAHLRRIYLKLGVFDRISAAIRGIGAGMLNVWAN
jgi:LuxR family transcriptional regulator, quorum-sensing system regulator CciR